MNNTLIEASAGTGKTQSLGRRLIDLIREGVKPQEIVALTFSRAAAGEIFERFVSLLAEEVEKGSASSAGLLRQVIATQHLSQIGTLDSFLMRIVRAFPLELGLVGDLEMMDDFEAESERAGISFSILRKTDARLKKAFVDAFSLAMNRENVRSFVDSYRSFIRSWHEKMTALPQESAWGDPKTIWGRDPAFAHVTERALAAAADRVRDRFTDDAQWQAFADWVRAFRGSFAGMTGLAKKLVESGETFSGDVLEFSFNRKVHSLSREETLIVRDALMCVFGYVVRMKLELARGVHRLIASFEKEYDARVRQRGRLVFSDVPRLIASLPEEKRLALEFRTDSHIRAWALDEFQDTSREQWKALANLIDEAKQSDGEKSLFIVGDTKQAIYGWRNGDVSIFRRERDSGDYKLKDLTKSYRSSPVVVEAVNRVFAKGRILAEFPAWECPEHASAKTELKGFVRTMDAGGGKMEDFVGPVLAALEATLGTKADDPRRAGVSAAVLVRSNTFGELLADRLKAAGFEGVVWEGESAILDTPALSGFLDLVQLADHPGDVMTYRHFRMTPIAAAKYPDGVPEASLVSREMSRAFTTRGLVRTFREIRSLLPEESGEAWSVFTEGRYTDMLCAAAEFELRLKAGTRLSDFAPFLASKKKRTVAEAGKVKVMTIHRSKGLGFDFVVLPLYEHDSLVAESKEPLVGDGWILPDPGARVAKAVGGLEAAYRLRKDRDEQEALCAYYVALTRAKLGLTVVLHPEGRALRFSDLVRSAGLSDLAHPEVRFGCADATGRAARTGRAAATDPFAGAPSRAPRRNVRRRLPSLQYSSGMSAGRLFVPDGGRRAAMARGTELHAKMEKVEFSDRLPKPEGFVELWRERAFEVFVDGEWISGRFDRVTFFSAPEGLSAEIVDFKSSLDHPERYDAQLAAYRRAVAALTNIPIERIAARLMLAD